MSNTIKLWPLNQNEIVLIDDDNTILLVEDVPTLPENWKPNPESTQVGAGKTVAPGSVSGGDRKTASSHSNRKTASTRSSTPVVKRSGGN